MAESPDDRLFLRLPGHLRARDAAEGHPLRALMRIAARELAVVEDDIGGLYDDWFIETCKEWVVPYIGDLVGATRLAPAGEGTASLRAYVANTLAYRRAKGTASVLEQLARDVTGFPARVVEHWRTLTQGQALDHVRLGNAQTVALRDADLARSVGTPFDAWSHTVDVRSIRRGLGRYNIPSVALHLWRLEAEPIGFVFDGASGYRGGVQPRAVQPGTSTPAAPGAASDGRYFLHPLGHTIALFNRPRAEPAIAHLAEERELPTPLRRLPLVQELAARRADRPDPDGWFGDDPVVSIRLGEARVPPESIFVCNLGNRQVGGQVDWRRPAAAGQVLLDPELGRMTVHDSDRARPIELAYAFGAVGDLGGGTYDRRESLASWRDDFLASAGGAPGVAVPWRRCVTRRAEVVAADPAGTVATLAEAIAQWNARPDPEGGRGIIRLLDNATYPEDLSSAALQIHLARDARLAIVADQRPAIAASLSVEAAGGAGMFVLDGLLVEGDLTVLPGDLGALAIHHSTIGAAGAGLAGGLTVQAGTAAEGPARANARIAVTLRRAILGRVALPAIAGALIVVESILGEDRTADAGAGVLSSTPVIVAPGSALAIQRSTVFGRIDGRQLAATELLATGLVQVGERQDGCVRYSLIPDGSRTGRRFRCQPDLALEAAVAEKRRTMGDPGADLTAVERAEVVAALLPRFTTSAYGEASFAQLHPLCHEGIAAGGESGGEIGAFAGFGNPTRLANLARAIDEYLPVGLEAGVFTET